MLIDRTVKICLWIAYDVFLTTSFLLKNHNNIFFLLYISRKGSRSYIWFFQIKSSHYHLKEYQKRTASSDKSDTARRDLWKRKNYSSINSRFAGRNRQFWSAIFLFFRRVLRRHIIEVIARDRNRSSSVSFDWGGKRNSSRHADQPGDGGGARETIIPIMYKFLIH